MRQWQSLTVETRDSVTTVTLDRPEVHNAFTPSLIAELTACFAALGDDPATGVIVLTGAGRSFSAGADIGVMRASLDLTEEQNRADAARLAAMFAAIDACPRPTVARVNGAAFGGGLGLIAACDIAIASESAIFAFSEAKLGIAPAVIAPYVVRRIGEGYARALFLTAARFSAARAREIGLVHEVVTPDELDDAVSAQTTQLLTSGPHAITAAKTLLRTLRGLDAPAATQETAATIARLRISPEGQEGLRAFLEKRKPAWQEPAG
ncbi:MAG: enoyl-CoA hydratase-related protein [Thermomicrobiales bacterium]